MKNGSLCSPTTLHVNTVMGSLLSSFQTGRLCRKLLWESFLLQASERNKETSARCLSNPLPVEEVGLLERGCSYSDRGIMGSLLLPPFPQLLEVS
ncbi:hypothetical protein AMECASPLE_038198 [Ameca splendens]|uniref:Uncharacterized protein n=1 Tax=Ameca splendens TaxID=208324 RepID=A0ABV0XX67_9TELE